MADTSDRDELVRLAGEQASVLWRLLGSSARGLRPQ